MALPLFTRVNEIVWTRSPTSNRPSSLEGLRPSRPGKTQAKAAPQTILFLSWGDASPRYIEKYTSIYSELWPEAKIILVTSGMAEFFWRTEQTSRKLMEPVVKMLDETSDQSLLVHVMSNAGSKQWCTLNKSFLQSTERTLSNATTIIDSAPGRAGLKQTWASLAGSLPRAFLPRMALGFIFSIVLGIMFLQKYLLPGPDLLEVVRAQLNDVTAVSRGNPRCYIYSDQDRIIGSEDVEDHAKDAKQKGWAVEKVKFQGSTHVGHLKQDPQRYRESIEKTWQRAKL